MSKIFAKHICDKGLISKIYEVIQLNNRKASNLIKNWVKNSNKTFFQRRYSKSQQVCEMVLCIIKH